MALSESGLLDIWRDLIGEWFVLTVIKIQEVAFDLFQEWPVVVIRSHMYKLTMALKLFWFLRFLFPACSRPVWTLPVCGTVLHFICNRVVIGYDEGTIMIKIGREEPVASMDSSGKIIWAKHNEIQTVNIRSVGSDYEVKLHQEFACALWMSWHLSIAIF